MIRIEGVSKQFGDLVAVDDLSLEISEGEIFGLLGPNGAGKSTIISMISGQQLPTSGELSVAGLKPTSRAAKRLIGVAPQAIALYEDLSALANLEFFGALYGMGHPELRSRTAEVLEFVGLTDRARDRVEKYSGGMKRRLNLAATLMHQPDILLLDEPTVGVDPQSRNKLFENVLDLKARGKTVVYTTHYMEEAERLCDRVGILDRGRMLALGHVDTLIDEHGGDSSLSISTDDGEIIRKSSQPVADLQALLAEHPDVRDLRLARPDLEQVFLNLTGRHLRD
ncbi:MAG: ATP-binding cassette domain-containing protein [Xanthomonadales bacterium]|nr:ABC transporter ATP-binding protein [Xanthomonadales bacterium]NIX13365.1 ATP-binding cassette domain-containing protein [Xanthomonadales bacterium]